MIERAIEDILGIPTNTAPKIEEVVHIRPKRGRVAKGRPPIWALEFYNPEKNRTFALISLCIKDDFDQSIEQLALKLSAYKCRPPAECLKVLKRLRSINKLGYYDNGLIFRTWCCDDE